MGAATGPLAGKVALVTGAARGLGREPAVPRQPRASGLVTSRRVMWREVTTSTTVVTGAVSA